jgi:hypothetical protein
VLWSIPAASLFGIALVITKTFEFTDGAELWMCGREEKNRAVASTKRGLCMSYDRFVHHLEQKNGRARAQRPMGAGWELRE